jgi:hypothetical protein
MNGFSPSEAALEGFRLTRERPGTVLAWSGLYFLGILVIGAVMLTSLDPNFLDLVKRRQLTTQDPEQVAEMLLHSWPAFIVVLVLTVVLLSIIMGGIYRLVLRPAERSWAHLRVGRDEFKLAGINLLLFAIGMVCLTIGFALTAAAEQIAPPLAFVALLVVIAVSVWLGVRLSLATPMTFATHSMSIREAWRLTRGHFWPLFGMIALAVIFYFIIWLLITIIWLSIAQLSGGQDAIASMSGPVAIFGFLATLLLQLLLPILQVIMIYSPLAVAYQQLHGDAPARPLQPSRAPG